MREVSLAPDKPFGYLGGKELTIERFFIRHIVDEENSHSSTVVGSRDCPEAFLPRSVPYLQLHSLAVQVNCSDLKVDADSRYKRRRERVFAKA